MAKALTTRTVETAQPSDKRREIPDGLLPGLFLIVQPSGAKSWAVRYRHGARTRKTTLGSVQALTLLAARDLARSTLRDVAAGADPGEAKQQARRAAAPQTVADAAAQFLDRHVRRHNRPATVEAAEQAFRIHVLPRLGARPLADIAKRDIVNLVDTLAGTKPAAAVRLRAVLTRFFSWCVQMDLIGASPAADVRKPAIEKSRDRILTDTELKLVWQAAEITGGPFGALIRLLISTGARRDEAAGMRWDEISLETSTWTLPAARVKNKRQHDIPISDAMLVILNTQPQIKGCPYVLTNDGKTAASNYGKSKAALDKLLPADMPHWTLHDLRRTCASGMARLGVSLPTIEKVLNHVSGSFGGIVSVYQRHDFANEKRAALGLWAQHVTGLADGGNVVALKRVG